MRLNAPLAAGLALLLSAVAGARSETVAPQPVLPQRLSETGLFAHGSTRDARAGILSFSPQYPLWSDGATKRRWIQLPPNSFVDASNPDAWEFPRGTRLWKEFSLGRPVETRLIERLGDGSWRFASYVWNEDGTDAVLAPADGVSVAVPGAPGKRYAIPSETDCRACHEGAAAPVLGFSALQLSPDRDALAPHAEPAGEDAMDLRALVESGWLRNLPHSLIESAPRIEASSPQERAALGYLHANCGHCHDRPSETGASVPVEAVLAQKVRHGKNSVRDVLQSLIGGATRFRSPGSDAPAQLVAPGNAQASLLTARMRSRDPRVQMPPLGTAIPDQQALALIERWIDDDLKQEKETPP